MIFCRTASLLFSLWFPAKKENKKKKLKHERYHPPTSPHWRRLLGNLPGNTYVQRWHYLLSFFFCLLQRHFRITDRLYCMRYVSAECEWLRAEITAANGSRLSIRVIFFCTCDSPLLDVIMCLKWAVFSWDKFRDLREVKSAVTSAKLIFSIRAKLRPLSCVLARSCSTIPLGRFQTACARNSHLGMCRKIWSRQLDFLSVVCRWRSLLLKYKTEIKRQKKPSLQPRSSTIPHNAVQRQHVSARLISQFVGVKLH